MSDIDLPKMRDDDPMAEHGNYEKAMNQTMNLVRKFLKDLAGELRDSGLGDGQSINGAPVLDGTVGAVIAMLIEGGLSNAQITAYFEARVEEIMLQARLSWDAHQMGAVGEGRA